jgi:hypothetical protein
MRCRICFGAPAVLSEGLLLYLKTSEKYPLSVLNFVVTSCITQSNITELHIRGDVSQLVEMLQSDDITLAFPKRVSHNPKLHKGIGNLISSLNYQINYRGQHFSRSTYL